MGSGNNCRRNNSRNCRNNEMRSLLLRFSLLLSLSAVDVNEKMAPIKSHKEPPDHKMDIKVGLHLDTPHHQT